LNKVIRDVPSQDGTTAFSIALAKDYTNIVGMFLDKNVGHSRSLYAEAKKTKKTVPNQQGVSGHNQ
jgi:hypothetical protein